MLIKNNSKRVIKLNSAEKGRKAVKLIPTKITNVDEALYNENKNGKVFKAWIKEGDIKLIIEADTKPELTAELIEELTVEEIADGYNMKELKAYAKIAEISGYSNMNQETLVSAIKGEEA